MHEVQVQVVGILVQDSNRGRQLGDERRVSEHRGQVAEAAVEIGQGVLLHHEQWILATLELSLPLVDLDADVVDEVGGDAEVGDRREAQVSCDVVARMRVRLSSDANEEERSEVFGGEIEDQLETEAERDDPDPDDAAPELILEKTSILLIFVI